jgi:Sec-independent protein translocase protein TatA
MRSFFSDYASALEYDNPGKVKIKAGTPDGDPGNGGGGSNGGGSNGGGTGPEVNCSTKLLNPLTWFMCPLIELATKTVKALDGEIMDLLEIDVGKELNEKSGDGKKYYESWSTFRFIALSLLVVIGLIMIISQAFSFGIFDAYTIKKIAPRILIAVIFIALSWPVTKFAIEISNDLGKGVRGIITAPFPDKVDILGGTESILALGVAGAAVALGALGLLSFALTALMAVLIAFFVLVVRKMLIFFLVILAPVAIICSILPNTQKVWKMWWDFFSKALLTFPIVAGMIAIGHSFAVVASRDKGLAGQAVAFIAYFGPYFIIPTAFKMAGGAIGQISGMVGDKSKGGFDRLKNFRGNQRKQKTQDLLSGNRLRGGNQDNFRGRVNRGLLGASKVGQMGVDPTRWRSRMRTAMNDSQEMSMEDQMKNSSFGVWGADDAKLHAARFTDRDQIAAELERQDAGRFGGEQNRRAREDAVTQIERTQREMGTQAFHRARVRAQAKTGTGYIDANGVFDSAAMLDDINMAYGSDRNGAGRALAEMRTSLTNSGQIAGQAGYGTWAQQMENTYNAQGQDQATRDAVHEAAHMAIMDDTIDSVAPGNALYGKPSSAAAVGAAHARRIQAISAGIQAGTHTEDDLSAAVAAAAGIYDAMGQASPGNASAMANELMGVALPDGPSFTTNQQETVYNPATGTPMIDATGRPVTRTVTSTVKPATVREYIEAQMNGNPEFVDRRRDLSQAAWRQAQQQQAQQQQGPQPPQAGPQINPQVGPPGP